MKLRITPALLAACICLPVSGQDSTESLGNATTHFLKEERDVQWTPHSVTVLTKDELESGFKRDLEDIESMVPGLIVDRMNTTPRGAAIALRGLGSSGASKAFDPAVAVNILVE